MKIIVDTNFFLDFYRQGKDHLNALDYMIYNGENVIFPEQIYIEFQRNMIQVQKTQLTEFKNQNPMGKESTSKLIRYIPEYDDFLEKMRLFNRAKQLIINKVEELIKDPSNDNVYKIVHDIYSNPSVKVILITNEIIEKAKNRHLLGNPPGTSAKTIGDEVVWESILAGGDDDVAFVTRDKTFTDNLFFLKAEYKKYTNYDLEIFGSLSDAITAVGDEPSDPLLEFESEVDTYQNKQLEGTVSFKYDDNYGFYEIGAGEYAFDTKWSCCNRDRIHAYNDGVFVDKIGHSHEITDFIKDEDIRNVDLINEIFNFTSRTRTVEIGSLVLWKNIWGNFAMTKIKAIQSATHGDEYDNVIFDYKIYKN